MPFPSQFKPKKPVECDEQAVKRNNSHVSRQILCQRFIGETGRRPTCRGCVGGSLCSLPSSPVLSIIQLLARRWLGSVCMRDLALIIESTMRLCATSTADTTPGPKRCQGGCVSSSRHLAELMIIMIRDDTLKLSSRVASMAS